MPAVCRDIVVGIAIPDPAVLATNMECEPEEPGLGGGSLAVNMLFNRLLSFDNRPFFWVLRSESEADSTGLYIPVVVSCKQ